MDATDKAKKTWYDIVKYLKENRFRLLRSFVNLAYLFVAVFLALVGLPRFIQSLQGMELQQVAASLFAAWLCIANFIAVFVYVFSNLNYRYVTALSLVSFFLLLIFLGFFALQEQYFYFGGSYFLVYALLFAGRWALRRYMPLPTEAK